MSPTVKIIAIFSDFLLRIFESKITLTEVIVSVELNLLRFSAIFVISK